jgi:hypothetical protein
MAAAKKKAAKKKAISKKPGGRKPGKGKVITFSKPDFEKFARKMEKFSGSLSPAERALLMVVLDKGQRGGKGTTSPVTTTVAMEASDFDIVQFLVELLLAIEGISAEVDEDGPSWVQEIDVGTT